jgi:hypothetical protein
MQHARHYALACASLGLAMLACSSIQAMAAPTREGQAAEPPTLQAGPTEIPATAAPTLDSGPMPGLGGYWQDGPRVLTIAWQDGQYVLTDFNSAAGGTAELLSQSWDGATLTWTYRTFSSGEPVTMRVDTVSGERLRTKWSTESGSSGTATLRRSASAEPVHDALPWMDDFSDPLSGWDEFESEWGPVKYDNGHYSVRSIIKGDGQWGYAYRYLANPVIAVDATAVTGPASNDYGFFIGCNIQENDDGYEFEVDAVGYYYVGKYTNNGSDYQTLFSGDDWRASNAIHTGKAANHVVVTCAQGELKLEVNGTVVWEGSDFQWSDGDISLGAISFEDVPVEYHFDNLVVTAR